MTKGKRCAARLDRIDACRIQGRVEEPELLYEAIGVTFRNPDVTQGDIATARDVAYSAKKHVGTTDARMDGVGQNSLRVLSHLLECPAPTR